MLVYHTRRTRQTPREALSESVYRTESEKVETSVSLQIPKIKSPHVVGVRIDVVMTERDEGKRSPSSC